MSNIEFFPSGDQEKEWVMEQLMAFNRQFVPLSREEYLIPLNFHVKEGEKIVAGVNATLIGKSSVYVANLWVHPDYRQHRYGSALLRKVEDEARQRGGHMVHLDTFDFQAQGFYIKQGYDLYAELADSPVTGRKRFYLRKYL